MLGQLTVLGLFGFFIVSSLPVPPIQERVDENGVEWVGPIRKCTDWGSDHGLDKCLTKIVDDITHLVGGGIEELGLEPLDPIFIKKFLFAQKMGPINLSVGANNIYVKNLPKYKTLKFKFDTNQKMIRFVYFVPVLKIDCDYTLGGNAMSFPLKGNGPAKIDLYKLKVHGHMNFFKTNNDNGESVIQLKETVIDGMKVKDMKINIKGLFDGNPLIEQLTNQGANNFGPQFFDLISPEVGKLTGDIITNRLLNPILSKLPYIAAYIPN